MALTANTIWEVEGCSEVVDASRLPASPTPPYSFQSGDVVWCTPTGQELRRLFPGLDALGMKEQNPDPKFTPGWYQIVEAVDNAN